MRSAAFDVEILPAVRGEVLPVLLFDPSVGLEAAWPLHSSKITFPSEPPMVSVTVTLLLAVVCVLSAYQISRSNVAATDFERTRTYVLPAVSVGVLAEFV